MQALLLLLSSLFGVSALASSGGRSPSQNPVIDQQPEPTIEAPALDTSSGVEQEDDVPQDDDASQPAEVEPPAALEPPVGELGSSEPPVAEQVSEPLVSEPQVSEPVLVSEPAQQQVDDAPIIVAELDVASPQNAPDTNQDSEPTTAGGSTPPQEVRDSGQDQTLTDTITVTAGRVTTLNHEGTGDVVDIKIVNGPEAGNVSVNPDNTIALVLTGENEAAELSFDYEVTYADGSSELLTTQINAEADVQQNGWGTGDFYMLETDSAGDLIIESGDNHRDVFVSGSDDALSKDDIAAIEGLDASDITGKWLEAHPEYGATAELALDATAGMSLWNTITARGVEPNSHWLQLEKGYEYDDLGRMINRGSDGESELHPQVITSYGEGADPIVHSAPSIYQDQSENIVISGVDFHDGMRVLTGKNILLDDLSFTGDEVNLQSVEGLTVRNSDFTDIIRDELVGGDPEIWEGSINRISGLFVSNSDGVMIDGNFFDHTGWAEGYDYARSTESGQSPSFYSHNVYIQYDTLDVTFRDNITMRGASFGAQVRPGGFIEDNVFLDNNAGVHFMGGLRDGEFRGNYSLVTDNVVTSGQHLNVDAHEGALTVGMHNGGIQSTIIDNIVTHLADPDNPDELDDRVTTHPGTNDLSDPYFDNTIVYNWRGSAENQYSVLPDENVDGLDTALLDETTIQRFAADLLGKTDATIADLADHIRAQADGALDQVVDADLIIAYFQAGFGITPDIRAEETILRFVPNDLGDGVRWDNRLNWTTEDLPGTQDGDSVNLGGNWVHYSGTTRLENMTFGDGGKLSVTQGALYVEGNTFADERGGTLDVDNAGQAFLNGYNDTDLLTINVEGGRFANTGIVTGKVDLTASDNAQVILATDDADFALSDGSILTITGDDTKVGFDGEAGGTGVLLLDDDATLNFVAEDGLGMISEFRSGKFGDDDPNIDSGVNLGDASLHLDISDMTSGTFTLETLIDVDQVVGTFGDITIDGLGATQDATIEIDYDDDTVVLEISEAGSGSGQINQVTTGDETNAQTEDPDLWAELTNGHGIYPEDPAEDIPVEDESFFNI